MTHDDYEIAQDAYLRRGGDTARCDEAAKVAEAGVEAALLHLIDCVKDKQQMMFLAIAASIASILMALTLLFVIYRYG